MPLPTLLPGAVKPKNTEHELDEDAAVPLPKLLPGIVKPKNTKHGLVGQQYTHKGNVLGTWLRPVCHFSFDGFFRTFQIDNLESDQNVDRLEMTLSDFMTGWKFEPEDEEWVESSGVKAQRYRLTFIVDDLQNVNKIQKNIEHLLGGSNQVPCEMF